MLTSIADAFRMRGIRAEYQGMPAMILPITAALADELDQTGIRQGVRGDQMLLSWNDGTGRKGKVLDVHARNDLTVLIRRNEGSDLRVRADRMPDAAIALSRAEKSARESATEADKANDDSLEAYEEAIARNDPVERPAIRLPEFAEDAFSRIGGLVACVRESQLAVKADPFADMAAKARADDFVARLHETSRDEQAADERTRVEESRRLMAEISLLKPDHPDAAPVATPAPYPCRNGGDAARTAMDALFETSKTSPKPGSPP